MGTGDVLFTLLVFFVACLTPPVFEGNVPIKIRLKGTWRESSISWEPWYVKRRPGYLKRNNSIFYHPSFSKLKNDQTKLQEQRWSTPLLTWKNRPICPLSQLRYNLLKSRFLATWDVSDFLLWYEWSWGWCGPFHWGEKGKIQCGDKSDAFPGFRNKFGH